MATARKKSAAPKAKPKTKSRKPAPAKAKKADRKPTPARTKPAAKKPVPVKAKAPGRKPAPARAVAKPAAKPSAKAPAKAAAKAPAKAAAKQGPAAKKVVGRPAVPGKKPVPVPLPPAKNRVIKLVSATAEAKALAAAAARVGKPGAKGRGSNRPEPEVRPMGVLPPSSQAKPRAVSHVRPVGPSRPIAAPKGTPKPQPARKGDDRLTPEDLKHFEQRLLEARARISHEMGHLESTVLKVNPRDSASELSGYSFHMADAGTDSMEREKAFDIASKEGRLLLEIDDALRRLYNGTFGICEVSAKPIGRARLEALPWARLSLDEQEKLEKEQRAGRSLPPEKE